MRVQNIKHGGVGGGGGAIFDLGYWCSMSMSKFGSWEMQVRDQREEHPNQNEAVCFGGCMATMPEQAQALASVGIGGIPPCTCNY
jgi:hypothetical protein